jgi:DNA-binding protein YbaB
MPTPFPDPRSLLAGLNTLERALTDFEKGRAGQTFLGASADNLVKATVNGQGLVVSIGIDDSQLALGLQPLASKVMAAVNTAIDAAFAATAPLAASFANALTIPGLPARNGLIPDYPDFVLLANTLSAQILANNPCQSTEVFACRSGRVAATVDAHRRVIALSYDAPPPRFASYLETHTVEALNCAIVKATDRPTDTGGATDGIIDSFTLEQLVLYAKGTLKLNDRVKVKTQGCADWATVANAGTVETNIGVQTELGSIVSRAKVVVRDRGIVHGFIHTADHLEKGADTQITGPVEEHAVVILPDLVLNVPFPGVSMGTIELEPGQSTTAAPGYYNNLIVKSGATANLSAGAYYFNNFDLEPQGRAVLDATAGPITIWVRSSFIFRGAFADKAGAFPRVFVGYLGTSDAIVESKYQGTLSAPTAKISISTIQSHEGAFHGLNIEVQPDTQICFRPFELRYDQLPGIVPPGGLPPPVVDLGFETVAGWSSPQPVLLTSVTNPVSQAARSLQITNVTGSTDVVSANFPSSKAPTGATRAIVDFFVPSNQPNPTNVGSASLIISIPSASINNLSLGTIGLTSLPRNQFSQLEFPLPTAVRNAFSTTRTDVSLKLTLAITSGSGPWYVDNIRFLAPPPAVSTLDPILSFETLSNWSCAQTPLTSNSTSKTNLTKSLEVTKAPGQVRIISVPFATGALSAPLGKVRIDYFKPSNQQNSGWHGQYQLIFDSPSGGLIGVSTPLVELTPFTLNAFTTIEQVLPPAVAAVVNGEFGDLKLTIFLNAVVNSGPHRFDWIRFV